MYFYQNSIYHREQRSKENARKRIGYIKRLMGTIKQSELLYNDKNYLNFENLNLRDQCKIELEKREEARQFLQKTLSFLNELHFVCEHSYLLLTDKTAEKSNKSVFLSIINSLELIIWKIHYIFETNNGIEAIKELEELTKKGLNCLRKVNEFNWSI